MILLSLLVALLRWSSWSPQQGYRRQPRTRGCKAQAPGEVKDLYDIRLSLSRNSWGNRLIPADDDQVIEQVHSDSVRR